MGIVDKLNQLMNPDSVEDYDDGDYMFGDDGDTASYGADYQQTGYTQAPQGAAQGFQPNALELKVVKPEKFEDASSIADHLLNKRTIVLNLEDTNSEVARRLIDFLSGVAYSIDGNLKKVADHTFVITPNNVLLSAERMSQQAKADTFGGF
ncbi:MAG: cell division protein SepF [Clostridiales bacterium]|nr:cell division protein SepF [Clostridiales bacterium]